MIGAIALMLTGFLTEDPRPLDGPRFVRAVEGLHEGIQDLVLVFEGGFQFVGPEKLYAPRKERPGGQYQGTYAYRDDGATLLETYNRSSLRPESPLYIDRIGTLRGRLEEQSLNPDRRGNVPINDSVGSSRSLDMPGSASRIILNWYFRALSARQPPPTITEQAWETVDGHRCLRVRVDALPGLSVAADQRRTERIWIDMERGGHPLKIEWLVGEKVDMRTRDIQLERFPLADGGHAWLPISGITESFVWGDDTYQEPIIRETYGVVRGSVQLNQHLSDRAFRLETASEVTGSPFLAKARSEYAGELRRKGREPAEPITPASVQGRLDRELAEADRQSAMLDASSAGSGAWPWATLAQLGLGIAGAAALVFAALRMRAR